MQTLDLQDRVIQEGGGIEALTRKFLSCINLGKFIGKIKVDCNPGKSYSVKIGIPNIDKPIIIASTLPLRQFLDVLQKEIHNITTSGLDCYETYLTDFDLYAI